MGYDIRLVDKEGNTLHSREPHGVRGGQYSVGEKTELSFYITYNYAPIFDEVFPNEGGVRSLYGWEARDTLEDLALAFVRLSFEGEPDPDYWKPTRANAREAIKGLILMALERPEGIWEGD